MSASRELVGIRFLAEAVTAGRTVSGSLPVMFDGVELDVLALGDVLRPLPIDWDTGILGRVAADVVLQILQGADTGESHFGVRWHLQAAWGRHGEIPRRDIYPLSNADLHELVITSDYEFTFRGLVYVVPFDPHTGSVFE